MSGQFARLNESLHRAHPTTLNQRIEVFASDLHAILDHYLITQNQAANDFLLLRQALAQLEINRTNFYKAPSKSICKMLAGGNDEVITAIKERING